MSAGTQSISIAWRPSSLSPLAREALLLLLFALAAFIISDPGFTMVDDETAIVTYAGRPITDTLRAFAEQGQHEHPPLSDLMLHLWIRAGATSPVMLRLPSVLCYLSGILILALIARKQAGDTAFRCLLWIGCLWPYGFHFGRLAGWYSFCFLLVAVLTWTYLRYLEVPTLPRAATVLVPALLLIYANYYGWVVLACLGLDLILHRPLRHSLPTVLAAFTLLCLAYFPMWRMMANIASGTSNRPARSLLSRAVAATYTGFSVFVSESIAPWFWWASIPAALAIATLLYLVIRHSSAADRRMLLYFGLLFAGLAWLGEATTKRVLFFSGWLLLPIAITYAQTPSHRVRDAMLTALLLIAGLGWFGIAERNHYATAHFIEPWASIADDAAQTLRKGGAVVSNSQSFLFYSHYALQRAGLLDTAMPPGWVDHPRILTTTTWDPARIQGEHDVLWIQGVASQEADATNAITNALSSECRLLSDERLIPDSGYAFKAKLFSGQVPFRVIRQRYSCAQ